MPALPTVALRDAAFSYGSETESLFSGLTVDFPVGFTGIVGRNGAGKTTLLRIIADELPLSGGFIEGSRRAVYCAQGTELPPADFQSFLEDWDPEPCLIKHRLEVDHDYGERWSTLSHGERKRAQIAHALWLSPDILAIDEPTNHLDAEGRRLVLTALHAFRGVGVIVSHDRALLDDLCSHCLFMEPPMAQLYPGGITQTTALRRAEREAAISKRTKLVSASKQLDRAAKARREQAANEHTLRSKKKLSRKDSDGREKIDRARVTDSNAGSGLRQLRGRMAHLADALAEAKVEKIHDTGMWLADSYSRRDAVLTLTEGQLAIAADRIVEWPDLSIGPRDRIAVMGRNGAGKSSWLRHAMARLNVPDEHVLALPQEIEPEAATALLQRCRDLPNGELGQLMTIVSRLNSRPGALLGSDQPSPGEVRKLLLAQGIRQEPHIIVMDEPTNHLDLPSIQALEDALVDCPCAMLIVSHDERFIERLGASRWHFAADGRGNSMLNTG